MKLYKSVNIEEGLPPNSTRCFVLTDRQGVISEKRATYWNGKWIDDSLSTDENVIAYLVEYTPPKSIQELEDELIIELSVDSLSEWFSVIYPKIVATMQQKEKELHDMTATCGKAVLEAMNSDKQVESLQKLNAELQLQVSKMERVYYANLNKH